LFNRPSKFIKLIKNENGKADIVLNGIYKYSKEIKYLTMDRGIEFLRPKEIKEHGIEPYYCDAMSPWQKGGCENTNGRLRRWLPKKTDITTLSQKDVDSVANNMNNTPRKCIGYKTPQEFYENTP
jgi:IS30 family transposase